MNRYEMSTLCFVYIKDSMFKGENFNFDSEYIFKVIEKDYRFLLTVEKKKKRSPNNFFGENISSVTAIVGKNGAGKSRALSSIFDNIGEALTAMNGECFIYIFSCDEKYYFYSSTINLDISSDFEEHGIVLIEGDNYKPNGTPDFRNHKKFFNKFVLFTNVLDVTYRRKSNKRNFCIDLTLNTEISEITHDKASSFQEVLKYNVVQNVIEFVNSEIYSEIKSLKLDSLPDLLRIRSIKKIKNDTRVSKELMKNSDKFYRNYIVNNDIIEKRHLKYGSIINDRSLQYEEALNSFALSTLLYLSDINQNNGLEISTFINQLANTNKNGIELLAELVEKHKIEKEYTEILYLVYSIIKREQAYILLWQHLDEFVVKIDKEGYKEITQIVDLIYSNDKKLSEYVDIDLQSSPNYGTGYYSTGEFYRYRLFAKFFEFYKKINEDKTSNKNILLLFDEIDVYYHPSLQTRVMNDLLIFLGTLFKEYNLQIILTTNNPYILSDIPNDKIIYLDRAEIRERYTLTFGANIHSLLKDSFYLDSTRGSFCKEIINKVADFLDNRDDELSYTKEYCQYVIENMGESIVRKKLEKMYCNKYPEEFTNENKIEIYRKEILRLQNSLDKSPNVQSEKLKYLNHLLKLTTKEIEKLVGDNYNDYN